MSILPSRENKTPPGGVCHDLWGAEFIGSPCHNRQVKYLKKYISDVLIFSYWFFFHLTMITLNVLIKNYNVR